MNSYDAICFDLDGTLWDATDAAVAALNLVATKHQLRATPITRLQVEASTGMPLDTCLESFFEPGTLSEQLIEEIEAEEARLVGKIGHTLYQGVEETLHELSHRYPLYLISNCGTAYLQAFFTATGLGRLFNGWDCYGDSQEPKAHMIENLINDQAISSLLYVGDTAGDHTAAVAAGASFCFVTYGFGEVPDPPLQIGAINELAEHLLG